jgi:hypothetical protein
VVVNCGGGGAFYMASEEGSEREVKGNGGRWWSSIKVLVTSKEITSGGERSQVGLREERGRCGRQSGGWRCTAVTDATTGGGL